MGLYYIDRKLFATDIYILECRDLTEIEAMRKVELSDKELKEFILKEEVNGREVKVLWKPLKRGQRKSNLQTFIETSRYNRVMNCDNSNN